MSEFFKSNPVALRHCIRFEILQGNSIEQAYSNICTVLGEEVIDYKNFEIRFNHFSKKKFNDKEKPCAKILRDDKNALRVCILYESLRYQSANLNDPIFEVFVNFCKVIGVEDVLKFSEFEFWFYRFLNGEFDLNYEKDEEKKIYELMDMPIDVMKNVVEYLDILDRANLLKTSRSLKTFVEDQKQFHHTLELSIFDSWATVSLSESVNIEYIWDSVGCKRIFKDPNRRARCVDHWKQALLDFKGILKNPKLHLDTLKIGLYTNDEHVLNDLKDELKFTHYLNVENVFLAEYSCELAVKIVPMLKPGYLTRIDILAYSWNVDSMKKVFEMEQWKQAKCFFMDGSRYVFSLRHLYHFVDFEVRLMELSVEDVREMKEILFKSVNFETCSIPVLNVTGANAIEEQFGDYIQQEENTSNDLKIYHYPIPNSTEYFEIKVVGSYIKITRMKR